MLIVNVICRSRSQWKGFDLSNNVCEYECVGTGRPTTPNHQPTHLPGRVSPIYKPKQSDSRDLFIIEHEIEVLLLIYCADEQTTT